MSKAVLLSACRTAGGKFGGQFQGKSATDLGAEVIREALARSGTSVEAIAEVIMGNGWQAGVGSNPARFAMYKAGIPVSVPAFTVNIRCGSGIRTVMLAADKVRLGDAKAVIAGGFESASTVPYLLRNARWGFRMGEQKAEDVLHADGFIDPMEGRLMGEITETGVVREFAITRQEQDEFASASHQKASAAIERGYFKDEIVPVTIRDRKKGDISYDTDEIPRKETSPESLAKLPAIFGGKEGGGTITAASSSALCDAASALVVADDDWAQAQGLKPVAEIIGYAAAAVEPARFPIAPVPAMQKAFAQAGVTINDMDLIEINEAFAAQVIACHRMMPFDMAKLNVCGGAIALGHPIGASGAKILTTLLYGLKRTGGELGVATACIGGGQGVAIVVKLLAKS